MLRAAVGVALVLVASGVRAQGNVKSPTMATLEKLAAANDLEFKGNMPFDLVVSFQLFDLNGKPTEAGSFEEWWAAPGSTRLVVHLPGFDESGEPPAGADPAMKRNAELVSELFEAAVRPVTGSERPGEELKQETRALGKTSLSCFNQLQLRLPGQRPTPRTFCTDPNLYDVRVTFESDGDVVTFRNSVGKFRDTYVARSLQISALGTTAITGSITSLCGFDPATSEVKLPVPNVEARSTGGGAVRIAGGVVAGGRIHFVEPHYPQVAKIEHLSGKVILRAVIAKDGSIKALIPFASTNPAFTDEAMTVVKQWKYSPYLLNGQPTEVDTTITVNFSLNP